ncbi:hypothetical protein [Synechococcus sp. PCC 7336]|nr:hypothetical protein [Synechococcus sp. PCC 7336]
MPILLGTSVRRVSGPHPLAPSPLAKRGVSRNLGEGEPNGRLRV